MRHEPSWDEPEGYALFLAMRDKGLRAVSYSLYGPDDRARHAFVWRLSLLGEARQRMSRRPLQFDDFTEELADQAAQGFYPAFVGARGDLDARGLASDCWFSAVYEEGDPAHPPRFIPPLHWSLGRDGAWDFVNELGNGRRARLYARSVGALGVPSGGDFRSVGAPGPASKLRLRVFATMWPMPEDGFAWAVHLHPNLKNRLPGSAEPAVGGAWTERWEVQELSRVAYPVAGQRTRHAPDVGSMTLSLWHDVRYQPWPHPDPFETSGLYRVVLVDDTLLADRLQDARDTTDQRSLTIGATFDGGRVHFFVPLGRPGDERPLERRRVEASIREKDEGFVPRPGIPVPGVLTPRALDDWLERRMRRLGARQAHAVVVRRGELVHARALTWAEPGYPLARLHHAVRLGSVSKALTAMMVLREIVPQLGLDQSIVHPSLLPPANQAPMLAQVRLRDLLSMRSGFLPYPANQAYFSVSAMRKALEPQNVDPIEWYVASPDMLSRYLQQHPADDYFLQAPGSCPTHYINDNFVLLGQTLAQFATGFPYQYIKLVQDLLQDSGVDLGGQLAPGLFSNGRTLAMKYGEAPCHATTPGVAWNRFEFDPLNPDPFVSPMCPSPYAIDGAQGAGAGGWGVPLPWFARIVRRLCLRPGISPLLSREQLEQMATVVECAGSTQAHGCYRDPTVRTYTFRSEGAGLGLERRVPSIRVFHNGAMDGACALWGHQFPVSPKPEAQADCISFCVAFNQNAELGGPESDGGEIFDAIQKMEDDEDLSPTDLFDVAD